MSTEAQEGTATEGQAQETEEFRELFRQAPVGFAYLDEECRVVRINSALASMTGLRPEECSGKGLSCLGNVIGPSLERLTKRAADKAGEIHNEEVVERIGGNKRYWLVSAYRMSLQRRWGVGVVVREVTDIRRLQDRLRRAERLEALGRMAGGTAHDLNNLLTGVIGNLSIVVDSHPERRFLEDALEAAEKAAELAAKLLAFTGKSPLFVRNVRIAELITAAADAIERPPNVRLRLNVPDTLPLIEADPDKLEILLENLLVNAYEAIGRKPGDVSIKAESVDWEGCESVAVIVEDTGAGIEDGELAKIFDPFYSSKFVGRGLGLSQALGIARSHGGTITVSSKPGQGSVFRVYLKSNPNCAR